MGRKQTRTGKYIPFCFACMIFLSLLGCGHVAELNTDPEEKEARLYLLNGHKRLVQGDYEGALNENQKVLSLSGGTLLVDEVLFNTGLIYAHPGNPRRDYAKSLHFFSKLVTDHPQSPLVEQAKAWVGVIEENSKLTQTVDRLNRMIEASKRIDLEIEQKKREKAK
jgi:tetratricopeptide (TPR) repeat protein